MQLFASPETTADQIVSTLRERNPQMRFAKTKSGDMVGYWSEEDRAFLPLVGRYIIDQAWVTTNAVMRNADGSLAITDWTE